ncbi:MAG: SDR family oxidoreductase [Hyphomicrobiales bacterium]|nr:SDR family oxidoreductase [Hyphomicrobiales bacterium]
MAIYPSLRGKAALVTGGGSGIGAQIVRRLAGQGVRVGFLDLAETPSRALVAELEARGLVARFARCDLRDVPALRAAIAGLRDALGPADILVNNAGHDERHRLADLTPEMFDDRVAVNLKHMVFAAQATLPDMVAKGAGVVINLGSVSWMIGQGGMPVYTAMKSAVIGLTRSIARDYGESGVRCVAVAPGWIMTERQLEKWMTPEGEAELMARQCLKRRLTPDDVARSILFYASDEAGAITNQHCVVDGGWT